MTGLDFSAPALEEARRLAAGRRRRRRSSSRAVRRARRARRGSSTSSTPASGRSCWLPEHRPLGRRRQRAAAPGGRLFIREGHPVLWASTDQLPDGLLVLDHPYFEQPEPDRLGRRGHVRRHRRRVRAQRERRVEPRPRRDRDRPARPRPRAHDARRARQRAVGRAPRPHGRRSAAASTASSTAPSACRTATPCRRQALTRDTGPLASPGLERLCHGGETYRHHLRKEPDDGFLPARAALRHVRPRAVPVGRDVRVPLRQAPQGLRRHAQRHARAPTRRTPPWRTSSSSRRARSSTRPPRSGTTTCTGCRWRPAAVAPERRGRRRHQRGLRLLRQVQGGVQDVGHRPVRLRLDVADARRRQARHLLDQQRRPADEARPDRRPHVRRLGARLLHRLPQPAPRLRRHLPRPPHQLEAARATRLG